LLFPFQSTADIFEFQQRGHDVEDELDATIFNLVASTVVALVVSVLATGPKGCGLKTRPRRWIFKGNKNPGK
jgi:hypothetical protein